MCCELTAGLSSTLTALSKRRHRTTTEAVYEEIQHRHNHFTQRGESVEMIPFIINMKTFYTIVVSNQNY